MKLASPRSNQSSRNKFEKLCYTAHPPPGIHPRGWWTTNWILLNCPRPGSVFSSAQQSAGFRILSASLLALRTPEGRATVLGESFDDAAAALGLAFLAFAVVDLKRVLEIPEFTRG